MAKSKKKKSILKRVWLCIGMIFFFALGSLVAIAQHKIDGTLGLMNLNTKDDLDTVDLSGIDLKFDKDVINILLVGVDKSKKRTENNIDVNNTDTMMIATMDLRNNELKVTSLMRDMYIPIAEPANRTGKLNSAYPAGGIKCLYKTIATNFGIKLDGYAIVNLDAFVAVVNEIGGVELDLTESEAYNLNNTNYIPKKRFRNVKVGKQKMNGWQSLGYCQIRHGKKGDPKWAVYSKSGKADDYGRTERQRLFLQALFKKVKSMSLSKWMDIVKVVMPNVTTDITTDEIYSYAYKVIQMGTTDITQFRVPVDGTFHDETIGGQEQLVLDIPRNKTELYNFIYGKNKKAKS